MRTMVVLALVLGGTASAGPQKPQEAASDVLSSFLLHSSWGWLRFAFSPESTLIEAEGSEGGHGAHYLTRAQKAVAGIATAEPDIAWIATDFALFPECMEEKGCKQKKPALVQHASMILRLRDKYWGSALFVHLADPYTTAQQAKSTHKLGALTEKIDAGAEAAVKTFTDTIGDPRALADSISKRTDVVLLGSDAPERFVGGGAVKAQLAKWKLAFEVRDGIQAGVSPKGSVAWVAANVDGYPVAKPAAKLPYRVTAIYEKSGTAWQLVVLHFSFSENPYDDMP